VTSSRRPHHKIAFRRSFAAIQGFCVSKWAISPTAGGFSRPGAKPRSLTRIVELAFPGNALEGFPRVLDPILVIAAVRRQEFDDLISAAGNHVPERTRGEIDRLADTKLMLFQLASPGRGRHGFRHGLLPSERYPTDLPNIAEKMSPPQSFLFLCRSPWFAGNPVLFQMYSAIWRELLQ
jgi:hypothetical protein